MRIGIIAALPGELRPLVRDWQKMPVARGSRIQMWQSLTGDHEVVAACAGMGAAAARRAVTAAEFAGTLDALISIGWAGALTEDPIAGRSHLVSEIIDAQTGERFPLGEEGLRLVTATQVADPQEKRRLAATYGATVVDMEAATVARLAQMRGIPFFCFKAVSDGVGADLPDLNPFIDIDGHLKLAAFLAHVAIRPRYWAALMQLGRNSAAAAQSLAELTGKFLKESIL